MGVRKLARRLFSRERRLSESVVTHTQIDEAVLRDWRKRAPVFDEAIADVPETDAGPINTRVWERLAEDTFYAYFGKDEPDVLGRDEIAPEFRVNRELADRQTRDQRFQHDRPKTRRKPLESMLGTLGALNSLRQSYRQELAEEGKRQSDIADEQDTLDDLDRKMAELREQRAEAADDEIPAIDTQIREHAQEKRAASTRLEALAAAQAAHAGDVADATRIAVQRAQRAAGEAVDHASSIIGIGPGKEPGADARIAPDVMFALAERYAASPILRRVAELMGKLELSMGSSRRTMRRGGSEEIVDIELGRELAAVLPQEKMLMRHPILRRDFKRRYLEASLVQYEMWSEQELKRGPVIVLADGSASMMMSGGARNVWARASTLAIVGIANREGRNAAAIEFGSPGQVRTFAWPKGRPLDPLECADFAEHAFNGGTSTLSGMREARDLIRNEAPFHAADLVIATDGEDRITDEDIEIRDELRAMGVRIHGIAIGCAPTKYLLEICERTTPVWEFDGHQSANSRLAIDLT